MNLYYSIVPTDKQRRVFFLFFKGVVVSNFSEFQHFKFGVTFVVLTSTPMHINYPEESVKEWFVFVKLISISHTTAPLTERQ